MRIAICQASAARGDKNKNVSKIGMAARAASAWHADLLIFPELFLTGYNIGALTRELAETTADASMKAISEIARNASCAIAVGFPERDGQHIFNSSALFDRVGKLAAVYRKMHLFGPKEKELFSPGRELVIARLGESAVGMSICYDIEFPEFVRELKRRGANVIIAPTANMAPYYEVPHTFVRARALENGVFVAYANLCGTEDDIQYTGLSGIVGPDGLDLARAGQNAEALLLAELPDHYASALISTQLEDLQLPPTN